MPKAAINPTYSKTAFNKTGIPGYSYCLEPLYLLVAPTDAVTREFKQLFDQIKQNLAQKPSPDKPREGKGITRRVLACLKRLEKKIPLHNGLPPEKQIRFYSLWHDFKLLARVPTVTPFSRRQIKQVAVLTGRGRWG